MCINKKKKQSVSFYFESTRKAAFILKQWSIIRLFTRKLDWKSNSCVKLTLHCQMQQWEVMQTFRLFNKRYFFFFVCQANKDSPQSTLKYAVNLFWKTKDSVSDETNWCTKHLKTKSITYFRWLVFFFLSYFKYYYYLVFMSFPDEEVFDILTSKMMPKWKEAAL